MHIYVNKKRNFEVNFQLYQDETQISIYFAIYV